MFTSFVDIIFLGLDFHHYDERSRRFRTSVSFTCFRRGKAGRFPYGAKGQEPSFQVLTKVSKASRLTSSVPGNSPETPGQTETIPSIMDAARARLREGCPVASHLTI